MTRDWWQTDPTYVIDDPPKGFECPPIFDFCWTNDASPWTKIGSVSGSGQMNIINWAAFA